MFTCLRLTSRLGTHFRNHFDFLPSRKKSGCQVAELKNRVIFKLVGPDTYELLQGLITNDINILRTNVPGIYTLFLNNKGRVIQDSFIYKFPSRDDMLLVECDSERLETLQKHIHMYRLRKKVDIIPLDEEFAVWVSFHLPEDNINSKEDRLRELSLGKEILVCPDPRLPSLGSRILVPKHLDLSKLMEGKGIKVGNTNEPTYRAYRYSLGVGEGVDEIPSGQCFPFEINCDYLNGVSFQKGCYIGQELTARTFHTGVVRKRLMPIFLESSEEMSLPYDMPVENPNDQEKPSIGKLKATVNNIGLALLRISEALSAEYLKIGDVKARTKRPEWWPDDPIKENKIKT